MVRAKRVVKDSVLSVVTIDNFAEEIASGRDILISLSPAANQQWWLDVDKQFRNETEYLSLHIHSGHLGSQKYYTEIGITLKNKNSKASKTRKVTDDFTQDYSWGFPKFIEMSEVLAENNGFSRNGSLTVQCEVRVYSITDCNGIRMFNFLDPFEGCVMFTTKNGEKTFYAMKEMVMLHSPLLAEKIEHGEDKFTFRRYACQSGEEFEWFLQLIHGLSAGQVPEWSLSSILDYAIDFGTFDVIQRSDILFSEFFFDVPTPVECIRLKRQLKRVKSLKQLKEVVEECQWNDFDSETMKRVASKFFSFSVDFRRPKKSV